MDMDSHPDDPPSRLASLAGYFHVPAIADSLSFVLPPFRLAASRMIGIGARWWEVWSLNSERAAYYPGIADAGFSVDRVDPPKLRRADGHLGRFDPTVNPQVFSRQFPWYPFIRHAGFSATHLEFTRLVDVWMDNGARVNSAFVSKLQERVDDVRRTLQDQYNFGTIYPELLPTRPRCPSREDIAALGSISDYVEALDYYSRIQREVKLAAAWLKMADTMILTPPISIDRAQAVVAIAHEGFMGTWINGAAEADVL